MWEGGWIKEGGAGEVDRGRGSGGSAESLNCIWPRGGVPLKALTWQQALSHLLSGKGSPGSPGRISVATQTANRCGTL